MPFVKAKIAAQKDAVSNAQKARHAKSRAEGLRSLDPHMNSAGSRIFDLARLSREMWCFPCNDAISFRFLEEESQRGLASVYKIKCHRCKEIVTVQSSRQILDPSDTGRPLFSINCKVAIGCIDTCVAHDQLNKILSAANLPIIHRNTIKLAEERMGPGIVDVAQESCRAAIAEERRLTQVKRKREPSVPDCDGEDVGDNRADSEGDDTVFKISGSATLPRSLPAGPPCHGNGSSTTLPDHSTTSSSTTPKRSLPKLVQRSLSVPPKHSSSMQDDNDEEIEITAKYDFGWDKRGTGFAYDSRSGRGCVIGQETKKVLAYGVKSKDCAKCNTGHNASDHKCTKNWTGSSKGMEPTTAVELIVKNPDMASGKVRIGTVIGDRDSSTLAALQRESPIPINKVLDVNHNMKGFTNSLWKLKTTGRHKFLSNECIAYFKRCFAYALAQNEGNVEGTRNAILNIVKHVYGEHEECKEWCDAKGDPDYIFKSLPGKKHLTCPLFRKDLQDALQDQADNAEQLAPCGSSQQCESFNQMVNTRAPKTRYYCSSQSNLFRVSAAVAYKNLGANHSQTVYQRLLLSPSSSSAVTYRQRVEMLRQKKATYKSDPEVKRRCMQKKINNYSKETSKGRKEGSTYVSGMAPVMERASHASAFSSWLPSETVIQEDCAFVIVDLETTGFEATAEIVQLAAKCGSLEFSEYMVPTGRFSPKASEVTGLSVSNGKLRYKGSIVTTSLPHIVAENFLNFLRSCGNQVVLVGHNIIRFDAPRIVKWLRQFERFREFCSFCHGFVDTLSLIKDGKLQKQEVLARKHLTSHEWVNYINNAHNAAADCFILDGLLQELKVDTKVLRCNVKSLRSFMIDQARLHRRLQLMPGLKPLLTAGVSQSMVSRMAENGITIEELLKAFGGNGRTGLDVCMSVQVNGKPRVTSSKKIIDSVEAFV